MSKYLGRKNSLSTSRNLKTGSGRSGYLPRPVGGEGYLDSVMVRWEVNPSTVKRVNSDLVGNE